MSNGPTRGTAHKIPGVPGDPVGRFVNDSVNIVIKRGSLSFNHAVSFKDIIKITANLGQRIDRKIPKTELIIKL